MSNYYYDAYEQFEILTLLKTAKQLKLEMRRQDDKATLKKKHENLETKLKTA